MMNKKRPAFGDTKAGLFLLGFLSTPITKAKLGAGESSYTSRCMVLCMQMSVINSKSIESILSNHKNQANHSIIKTHCRTKY